MFWSSYLGLGSREDLIDFIFRGFNTLIWNIGCI